MLIGTQGDGMPGIVVRCCTLLLLLLAAPPALAEKRVAFLVGNAAYRNTAPLANPEADVALIGQTLGGLGFEVAVHTNLDRGTMGRALSAFLTTHRDADVTLFYYAGHGMQYNGENYLLGVDADLQSEFDVDGQTIALSQLSRMVAERSRAALIFVDACRDNPLADRFYRTNFSDTRALRTRGLLPVTGADGTMYMFSASPGQVAYDGEGGNSAFAQSLAKHLATENVEVLSLMKRVIGDVRQVTGDRQVPIVSNDLVTEIYFNLGSGGAAAAHALRQEQILFDAAMGIGTRRAWDIFLSRYPAGTLAEMAVLERDRQQMTELAAASGTEWKPGERIQLTREVIDSAERSLALGQNEVRAIQQELARRGYAVGTPDGRMGPRSRQALADLQASLNLPITGLVTEATAAALGVTLARAESGEAVASSRNARRFDPEQLALIETDPRLIRAAKLLVGKEYVYGFYQDRLYIGLLTWNWRSRTEVDQLATSLGGYLATLNSREENLFAYDLVKSDIRFWRRHSDYDQTRFGPTFGLRQLPGAHEPAGGWVWGTGEPVNYTNWQRGSPINHENADMAAFMWDVWPRRHDGTVFAAPVWHDFAHATPSLMIEID